jgi:hypothetical protein
MEGIKEKLDKEWNCNSEHLTKCHFPEFEGVRRRQLLISGWDKTI